MVLDYGNAGEVKVDTIEYVNEMVEEFKIHLNENIVHTPAAHWVFEIREHDKQLNTESKEEFHTMVAKALFLCKRGTPDIMTAVAFLSTRVRELTNDDWRKLVRMMQYLKCTNELVLTLWADNTNICK